MRFLSSTPHYIRNTLLHPPSTPHFNRLVPNFLLPLISLPHFRHLTVRSLLTPLPILQDFQDCPSNFQRPDDTRAPLHCSMQLVHHTAAFTPQARPDCHAQGNRILYATCRQSRCMLIKETGRERESFVNRERVKGMSRCQKILSLPLFLDVKTLP